ncbi:MAG TPA: fimbria/pilus outer membrane usher protein, partial [Anaeromyxobacteraceae bacterium]|nr:fimbria/pilus outer membrane usher protein [Anaeromyxobacteraceae bacterium]
MLFARHQAGWTNTLTSGLRLEAGEELASAGASLLLATPLGEVETGLAGSVDEERLGAAGLLAWRWSSRMLATTTYLRLMSPRYAHASLAATGPRDLWRAGVSVTAPARWGSLTVDYSASHPDLGGVVERTGVRALFWFAPGAAFSVHGDVTRTPQVGWSTSAFANVTVTVAPRTSATTGASVVDERLGATAAVQRDLPAGTGVGYRLNGFAVQEAWNGSATLQAQSGFGRYELVVDRSDGGTTSGRASASGAVIGIGRKAFFSRPVTNGYALVRVPGVDGVRAFRENREVGRTDGDGDLLVTDLLAHYANHLSISDKDIPQDFDVRETKKTMAVPRRGGTLAVFDV